MLFKARLLPATFPEVGHLLLSQEGEGCATARCNSPRWRPPARAIHPCGTAEDGAQPLAVNRLSELSASSGWHRNGAVPRRWLCAGRREGLALAEVIAARGVR